MELSIISGRSGSGKSISLHVLEDLGYYCIDNLPVSLLPGLIEHIKENYDKVAIGIDARNLPHDLDQFHQTIKNITQNGLTLQIIYLDADDNTLLKRFSETRRKHPLSNKKISLHEAIQIEKKLLLPIAHLADLHIDTTQLTLHQLSQLISERVNKKSQHLSVLLQSFGYKYGIPTDSDFIFDVRFLPNPYWQMELRPFTGQDDIIQEFLADKPETGLFLQQVSEFLSTWIPHFEMNNRKYITISVGCTGGQHRSVFIIEKLFERLKNNSLEIQLRHRELT